QVHRYSQDDWDRGPGHYVLLKALETAGRYPELIGIEGYVGELKTASQIRGCGPPVAAHPISNHDCGANQRAARGVSHGPFNRSCASQVLAIRRRRMKEKPHCDGNCGPQSRPLI